jgi:glycosyltransferase involved in cell wall biosynthesis
VSIVQHEVWDRLEISNQALFKSPQCIQVILAALNEEEGIAFTINELREHLDNPLFLVVDGNSTDNTVEVAKSLGTEVVCQKGTGKGDALNSAIEHINSNANYIVLNDADYTYPAAYLPLMIKILDQNPRVGMVCGNRFNSDHPLEGMKEVFRIGNKLIAIVHSMFTGVSLNDPLTLETKVSK